MGGSRARFSARTDYSSIAHCTYRGRQASERRRELFLAIIIKLIMTIKTAVITASRRRRRDVHSMSWGGVVSERDRCGRLLGGVSTQLLTLESLAARPPTQRLRHHTTTRPARPPILSPMNTLGHLLIVTAYRRQSRSPERRKTTKTTSRLRRLRVDTVFRCKSFVK